MLCAIAFSNEILMENKTLNVKIEGMHCHSCEILIENSFKGIPGVKSARTNYHTGNAEITSDRELSIEELQQSINDADYTVHESSKEISTSPKLKDALEICAYFIILIGAYYFLKQFNLMPSIGISDKASLGVIFLIGLVASVSSCMAVTGGLLISVAAKYNEQHQSLSGFQKFKPHIYFNIGRILSYTILGGLIGVIGSLFPLKFISAGTLTIIASVIMIVLGLQMLRIFPFLSRLKIRMPKFFAHKVHEASAKQSGIAPFLFGAATFFFPCGFTQALQFYVLSKGSFMVGASVMLAFSLGTMPALMSLGAFFSYIKGNFQKHIMKFSAILVILLGAININNGLAVSGIGFGLTDSTQADTGTDYAVKNPYIAKYMKAQSAPPQTAEIIDGKQIARMKIEDLNYIPAKFIVKQGIPVEWQIDASQAAGCAQVILSPKLGITQYLSRSGITKIEFTPSKAGNFYFTCPMAMTTRGASFIVV